MSNSDYYFKTFNSRACIVHLIFVRCGQLQITKSQILSRIFLIITSAIGLFVSTLILQVIYIFRCSPIGSRLWSASFLKEYFLKYQNTWYQKKCQKISKECQKNIKNWFNIDIFYWFVRQHTDSPNNQCKVSLLS